MIFNKQKRIQYLGFNDFWFVVIGILILSFTTDYLFNNSFARYPLGQATIQWSISLFFTICNWFIMRTVLIYLRVRYPSMRDSLKRILLVLLAIICSVILIDIMGGYILSWVFGEDYHPKERLRVLVPIVIISIMVQAIYEAIYHYIRLKKSIRDEEQAKQVIVEAQLEALRNQAQPHFFFNTLNTLRDIIDQNSKEDAMTFVDKLSDVYRFILESGNANLITLQDELKFAKAYIHIQSERFGNNLKVQWDTNDEHMDQKIVPMSLQLLLENAIKHNIVSNARPLTINIKSTLNEVTVSNIKQLKSTTVPSTKMGLKNIIKRYKLISYKTPVISDGEQLFEVTLPLLQTSDLK